MELTDKQARKLARRMIKYLLIIHNQYTNELLDKTKLPPEVNKIKYRLKQLESDIVYFNKRHFDNEEEEGDTGWE
jgi:hypothetical protein